VGSSLASIGLGQGIGQAGAGLGEGISEAATGIGGGVSDAYQGLGQGVGSIGQAAGEAATGLGEGVGQIGKSSTEILKGLSAPFGYVDKYWQSKSEDLDDTESPSWLSTFTGSPLSKVASVGSGILGVATSAAGYLSSKLFKKDKKEQIAEKYQKGELDIYQAFSELEGREITKKTSTRAQTRGTALTVNNVSYDSAIQKYREQAEDSEELAANLAALGWSGSVNTAKEEKKATRAAKTSSRNASRSSSSSSGSSSSSLSISKVKNYSSLSATAKRKLAEAGYK
jgi:hypothetical protein